MIFRHRYENLVRLVNELDALAGEDQLRVIRCALEKRRRSMVRAPFVSRVLTPEEVEELLSYGPAP